MEVHPLAGLDDGVGSVAACESSDGAGIESLQCLFDQVQEANTGELITI